MRKKRKEMTLGESEKWLKDWNENVNMGFGNWKAGVSKRLYSKQ